MKAQLDYISVNKKWINSVQNYEAYNSIEGVSSDHRIVSIKVQPSLRANKKKSSIKPPFDWKQLSSNADIRNKFTITLQNRFSQLQNEDNDNINLSNTYINFMNAHKQAAEDCIPLQHKTKRKVPWENEIVEQKRECLKILANLKNKTPTSTNIRNYRKARQELEETYNIEQHKYIQEKIETIRNADENKQSSLAWQMVNEVIGQKRSTQAKLKASSQDERLQKWKEHFQNLLGKAPVIKDQPIQQIIDNELPIKKGPFSEEELEAVLKKLKNKKAPGLDEIPPEVWKTSFNDILLKSCNSLYNQSSIQIWTEGCILPFPKKGDLSLATNYGGITLTPIAAKIYNSMLLNRIQSEVEKVLRRNQNGFRKNRSTVGQILTVRRIIEGVKANDLEAVILFVDFSKAFDSIHHGKIAGILQAYRIPNVTIAAIMMLYRNTKAMVRSPDGDTDFFNVVAGVLQGDTLAPFLFILTLDYVLRTSLDKLNSFGFTLEKAKSRRYPAKKITDADYTDDLALFSNKIDDAERLLHAVEEAAARIGLYVNAKKTEYVCYKQNGEIKDLKGTTLKEVEHFTYLGSNISSTEKDVTIRIAKAWSALNRLRTIWKSSLPDNTKRNFFRAVVESVLICGSTAWTLTKHLEDKLDGTYTRMLCAILNNSWKQHPTNDHLYGNIPKVSDIIREWRTRFAGYCWRSKNELASDLWIPKHGYSQVGRPCKSYISQLAVDTQMQIEDLKNAMEDQNVWRQRVRMVRATRPIPIR